MNGRKNFPQPGFQQKSIWMHCASLGEFEQGRPVLEAVRKKYPHYKVVLSFFSPSGYEIRKNYEGADAIIYLPADSHNNARKLIENLQPALVLWVKYEYWFYYLRELHKRKVPVILVSGIFRPSQPFFAWYGGIWRQMLSYFSALFVQNQASLDLLQGINIQTFTRISGDTRFDRVIDIAESNQSIPLIQQFIAGSSSLVAGSTWEDDEIELIHYVKLHPEIKFIIAPHEIHEENLRDVKKEFVNSIFFSELQSGKSIAANTNVLIIDNIGMLSTLYRYADIAYVGGGFGSDGIHNTLEAAVYGKPVLFGPVYEKFAEARGLVETGGAFSINNALELEKKLDSLFKDDTARATASYAARQYVYQMRGATKNILYYIEEKRLLIN